MSLSSFKKHLCFIALFTYLIAFPNMMRDTFPGILFHRNIISQQENNNHEARAA